MNQLWKFIRGFYSRGS